MSDIDNLTFFEKDLLLSHFLYKMETNMRREIMEQYPAIYNKLCGREIVKVVHVKDGRLVKEFREMTLKISTEENDSV